MAECKDCRTLATGEPERPYECARCGEFFPELRMSRWE